MSAVVICSVPFLLLCLDTSAHTTTIMVVTNTAIVTVGSTTTRTMIATDISVSIKIIVN